MTKNAKEKRPFFGIQNSQQWWIAGPVLVLAVLSLFFLLYLAITSESGIVVFVGGIVALLPVLILGFLAFSRLAKSVPFVLSVLGLVELIGLVLDPSTVAFVRFLVLAGITAATWYGFVQMRNFKGPSLSEQKELRNYLLRDTKK